MMRIRRQAADWEKTETSPKKIRQMANKHMKRTFTSYVIKETQIKTARYYHMPIRSKTLGFGKIQNTDNTKYRGG